jgi:hypothetical protein
MPEMLVLDLQEWAAGCERAGLEKDLQRQGHQADEEPGEHGQDQPPSPQSATSPGDTAPEPEGHRSQEEDPADRLVR